MIWGMHLTRWISSLGLILLLSLPAMAQQAPQIGPAGKPDKPWLGMVIAIVLVIGVGVASFMTPKRDHQD